MYKITSRTHIKTSFIILSILLLTIFNINSAIASDKNKIVNQIKSYIQNIGKVEIPFEQSDLSEVAAYGILIIEKPHKFRVNYFEPFPLLIVGNVNYVSVYDYEMENLSRIDAKENIFDFLLVDKIDFENHFRIISAKDENGYYKITVNHIDSGRNSEIEFDKNTGNISSMKIIEDNNVINLKFGNTKKLAKVDKNLFILQNPDVFGKPKRLDQDALKKKLQYVTK